MKIGVVSDTHGYFDPLLISVLAGVDRILHAGDVGSREVLDELELIAPTQAVRGNVDPLRLGLPPSCVIAIDGLQVELLHILPTHGATQATPDCSIEAGAGSRERPRRDFGAVNRMVVFGHTHQPAVFEMEGTLFVNPGSAGRKRFSLPRCCALMQLSGLEGQVNTISLEGYNRTVISSIRFEWEYERHA